MNNSILITYFLTKMVNSGTFHNEEQQITIYYPKSTETEKHNNWKNCKYLD
jgi:hypothetical protein